MLLLLEKTVIHSKYSSYLVLQFKSRSSTCYGDVPVCKDGFDDMTSAHQICVPRMRDLLSRPLARLRGHTSETLLETLDQFDLTLSENTSAIQASVNSIVRAPIHLAEKLQPVIEELISAQTSLSGPNPIGEPSRSNNCGDEYDFVDTHTGNTNLCLQIGFIFFKIFHHSKLVSFSIFSCTTSI